MLNSIHHCCTYRCQHILLPLVCLVSANTPLNVEITFETKADAMQQVFDMTGRTMKNGTWKLNKGFNTNEITVGDLVDGQYIFRLKSSEKVITEKFSVNIY